MIYTLLDIFVLALLFTMDEWVLHTRVWRRKATWIIWFWLMLATFVFDTFLTSLPIVTYDAAKISGVYLGSVPIEDFGYTVALVIVVPMIWETLRHADRS